MLVFAAHTADAQWRATAWTMDFQNDTDRCVALTVGAEGAPPIDAAVVWAHHAQHFDDNHMNLVVHAKVFERDCSGRAIADVHDGVRQLRNILTLTQAGSGYALRRAAIPDAGVTTGPGEIAAAPSGQAAGENFQAGPAYRAQSFALGGVRLGDDARAVRAVAAAAASQRSGPRWIGFATRDGADVTVQLHDGVHASTITYAKQTSTPARAAAFARAALDRYGWKPTTQVSGAAIRLQYCAIARGASATDPCAPAKPVLAVNAAVPQSTIELH